MMEWDIDFISRDNFKKHVKNTIETFTTNLQPKDLEDFNKNIIDPVKMMFDKAISNETWEGVIQHEITRQRDKSNNNDIGYFHQNMFKYIANCEVPANGEKGGWDVIYRKEDGISIIDEQGKTDTVHTIYAEMKNKHNTLNKASGHDTYTKMQAQLLKDDDCFCFLTEVIARHSQNIIWKVTLKDGTKASHKRIRRVSIDKFYEIITGDDKAFYKICMQLPDIISEVLSEFPTLITRPKDTVFDELTDIVSDKHFDTLDESYMMALFLLGFSEYAGFSDEGEG